MSMNDAEMEAAVQRARRLTDAIRRKHGLSLPSDFVNDLDDAIAGALAEPAKQSIWTRPTHSADTAAPHGYRLIAGWLLT